MINSLLIKFGQEKYMLDLYENGTIYLDTIQEFRKKENDKARGDKYEGAYQIINSLPGNFKIFDTKFSHQGVHIKQSYTNNLGNLYCLYCFYFHDSIINPYNEKIDERMREFGTHCVLIKNQETFLTKIERGLREKNHNSISGKRVDYYDEHKINKEISVFEKRIEYEYQNEFRIFVDNTEEKPIIINIGSLKEYAALYKIEDIFTLKVS